MRFEPAPEASVEKPKLKELVTAKGSVYRYLPDGRTQRFKTATGELKEPQSSIVFVPTWEALKGAVPNGRMPGILAGIENQAQFTQFLLEYVQLEGRTARIVDQDGRPLLNNKEIREAGRAFLALIDKKDPKKSTHIPISKDPVVGYSTYDETYGEPDEEGSRLHHKHLGNAIEEIRYE